MADDAQSVPAPEEPAPAETVPTPEPTVTESPISAETVPTPEPAVTESVAPAEPTPEVIPEVSQSPSETAVSPVSDRLQVPIPDPSAPASPEPQPIAPTPVSTPPQQPPDLHRESASDSKSAHQAVRYAPVDGTPPLGASTEQTVQATQSKRWSDADRARANATHERKKETRLAKIVLYARTHGRVANDGIVKLLRVSDATASRYANMLVTRGALAQEGKGRGAHYNFKP